jgi:hypothetical protein
MPPRIEIGADRNPRGPLAVLAADCLINGICRREFAVMIGFPRALRLRRGGSGAQKDREKRRGGPGSSVDVATCPAPAQQIGTFLVFPDIPRIPDRW